jgi:hypothetical protein
MIATLGTNDHYIKKNQQKTLAESTLTGTVPPALKPGRLQNKASKGGR